MRFYCRKIIYTYFREYVESIIMENDEIILFEDNTNIEIKDDNVSNVFISYIPELNNIKFKNTYENTINLFYLNTEQLTRNEMKDFITNNILVLTRAIENIKNMQLGILDYSKENIDFLKNIISNNKLKIKVYHIPYQYNEKEISKLKKLSNNTDKQFDFSFSGTPSEYRNNVIREILNNKMSVNNVNGWYNERDLKIAKSKILLNIHYNPNYNIYESIRCDRWIFSENLVLTEESYKNDYIELKDFMISTEYRNLAKKANEVVNNYTILKKSYFSPEKKILLKTIVDNRKKIYNIFRNLYK